MTGDHVWDGMDDPPDEGEEDTYADTAAMPRPMPPPIQARRHGVDPDADLFGVLMVRSIISQQVDALAGVATVLAGWQPKLLRRELAELASDTAETYRRLSAALREDLALVDALIPPRDAWPMLP